ncbi:MAG: reactive intermediate/imine deaminase [Chloroflexi bacterium 13_1_40CM_3_70_6]|nr:MAG: reactive intermediate/imine deaminase [Chloroflexi bacterium 13_1_40CM_3_70_6]
MELRTTRTDRAPAPVGPYSQAVVAGDFVFCAGQIALDPASGELVGKSDVRAQTRRVLDNLAAVLMEADSSLDHVTKTTVFLVDMADFAAMNEVYAERFGGHRPARSTVPVGALPRGAKVEIECIAVRR